MAEAFFNRLARTWRGTSAGIRPDETVHPATVAVMAQVGIKVGRRTPRRLTRRLLESAERVIVLDRRVLATIPRRYRAKVTLWRIASLRGKTMAAAAQVRDVLGTRTEQLRDELEGHGAPGPRGPPRSIPRS